jgi:hypothetical protein
MVHEFGRDLQKHPVGYQDLKWGMIAALGAEFELTSTQIREWVDAQTPEITAH